MRRLVLTLILGPMVLVALHMALFRVVPVPLTPLMLIRWKQDHPIHQTWVPMEEISPHLPRAVIAAEDNRFCVHNGVDWSAVQTVVDEYRDEGRLRGASTISMQTTKNLYLWPGRSVLRKALEGGLVYALEWAWTKARIMEVYLNVVEFGPGIYGAQAAAQHHFGRDAADLSFVQAAALASILPDPLHRDPTHKNKAMGMRVQRIRTSLGELGTLLACVPPAPQVDLSAPKADSSGGAPQHFQAKETKAKHQSTPEKPRRGKHQKFRSKRRRRPR